MPLEVSPWQGIIGPTPPSAPLWPLLAWGLLGVLLLGALLWILWRWWRQPRRVAGRQLGRIRRGIASGALEPRAGLHAAAACLAELGVDDGPLQQRFAAPAPRVEAVESLLRQLQEGLRR